MSRLRCRVCIQAVKETPAMKLAGLLVLGTHNRSKAAELVEVFCRLPLQLRCLAEFAEAIKVDEQGDSFAKNAALKATLQAKHLGQWVLGEDSGLVVDALGGEPGIFSARYSGPEATDTSNNRLLLERLEGVPLEKRSAAYVCHMAVADPQGIIRAESQGTCKGRIVFQPRGTSGFGYDPLFEVVEYHRTFGQLSALVKSHISHRSKAAYRLVPQLLRLIEQGDR